MRPQYVAPEDFGLSFATSADPAERKRLITDFVTRDAWCR